MVQKSGTRLSGGVKKSIKMAKQSGSLSGAQAQALRKQLRSPGVSKRETTLVGKATSIGSVKAGSSRVAGTNVYTKQATRSKARAAGKAPPGRGTKGAGKPTPGRR